MFLSPLFNDAQLDNNGNLLDGGKVSWYVNHTTTPANTYVDKAGSAYQSNPVVLNVRGEPDLPIWLDTDIVYTAVLTDSLNNHVRTIYDISGVNAVPTQVTDEWIQHSANATYISGTSFSVVGDFTTVLTVGRRLKIPVSGGDSYSTILTSAFAAGVTTVTIVNDGIGLDASISDLFYGFMNPLHPSTNPEYIPNSLKSAIQSQAYTAITAVGVAGAFTATAVPAITSYANGQRFRVRFSGSSGATNTLSINGLAALPIRFVRHDGFYQTCGALDISSEMLGDIEYYNVLNGFILYNPLPVNMANYLSVASPQNITSVKTFDEAYEPIAKNICRAYAVYNNIPSSSLSYVVTSEQCVITQPGHDKMVGSITRLLATGVLASGSYKVVAVSANDFTVACPGTINGSGSLTVDCYTKDQFNIAQIDKAAGGDVGFTFTFNFFRPTYTVAGAICGAAGSLLVTGTTSGGPTSKTPNYCRVTTTNSGGTKTEFNETYVQFLGK